MSLLQKLFEGSEKSSLSNEDRIATAIEGQTGANWISFANLYTQIKNAIIALFDNKSVLDELGDDGGQLTYNGNVVSNSLASGESNEVQFRNSVTGALDSAPLFKYDKDTGALIAGKTIKSDNVNVKYVLFSNEVIDLNGDYSIAIGEESDLLLPTAAASVRIGNGSSASGDGSSAIGNAAESGGILSTAIGNQSTAYGRSSLSIGAGVAVNEDYGIAIGFNGFLRGNTNLKWFIVNAAQLIRSFEITSIAPVVTGTVTAGRSNTLTDSSKTYILDQYANYVVEKTTIGGEKEQRVILSNTVAGQLIVRDNWTVTPVAGDTFKIITTTIITSNNLGSIYRFNLSGGFDHALILPAVNDTFNRAFCEFYIEGHANGAVLHKFPATGQLIQGQPKTEMVSDRELVRLLSHASGAYHWDVESTAGIDAFGEAVWAPQVITATQTTPRPLDGNLTINLIRRFSPVNVGGSLWAKYTSSLKRKFRFQIVCDITLNGTPSSIITIGIRYYNAEAGTTTDILVPGSSIPIAGNGTRNVFVLSKLIELNPNDRFQIVHYNNNNTSYTLTPQLTVD